ncbi:hypothetical protein [Massilia oculi]|uniref:hypothetical protein n=1 Tax=Massilia oculi TaxID=945844 RepID=UPI001AAF8204|nr:hypothetical protein [Massilia oculi]
MRLLPSAVLISTLLLLHATSFAQDSSKADPTPSEAAHFLSSLKARYGEEAQASPLSFDDVGNGSAITGIKKNKDDKQPTLYQAKIQMQQNGAELNFLIFSECTLTDPTKLTERIIKISGQKVVTYYACANPSGKVTGYRQVYLVKSPKAKEFLISKFHEQKYVFIEFDGFPVPFETVGFTKFWDASSGSAL